jgi:hypothetical protein
MCDQPKAEGKENSLKVIKAIAKANGREPSTLSPMLTHSQAP